MTFNKHIKPMRNDNIKRSQPKPVPDGGWGWIVTMASSVGIMLTLLLVNNFGIFYTYMMDELGFELTTVTVIGSTNTAILLAAATLAVAMTERFGLRPVLITGGLCQSLGCLVASFVTTFPTLFIFIGIVNGFGAAISFATIMISVRKYFDKKLLIAMTLATIGGSINVVAFPLTIRWILGTYGLSGGLLIMSAILLNNVVCASVVFPLQKKCLKTKTEEHDKEPLDLSFCKNAGFISYLATNFLFSLGYYISSGLLPDTALSNGVDLDDISLTFTVSGIVQIVGRLLLGFLSYRYPHYLTKICSFFMIGMGLSMLIVPYSTTFSHYLAFNMISGFFHGGVNLAYSLVLTNKVDAKYYGRGLSLALFSQSLASLAGNPFAAFLQETTCNRGMPYYMGTTVFVLAGLVLLPFSDDRQKQTTEIELDVTQSTEHTIYTTAESNNIRQNDFVRDQQLIVYKL